MEQVFQREFQDAIKVGGREQKVEALNGLDMDSKLKRQMQTVDKKANISSGATATCFVADAMTRFYYWAIQRRAR